MKVLALNSSPRSKGQSKTEIMLNSLADGMREAGASVEVVELRKKSVKSCIGCFTCWTKTPGKCIQKDEMTEELFPKWVDADLAIYATPIYHWTMNATMKAFIERTLPVVEPFFIKRGDRWAHPVRENHPLNVVLAVAAFPEDEVFSFLSANVKHLFGESLVAEIYRGSSEMMVQPLYRDELGDILEATARAGAELVEHGKIAPETMTRIRQPVGDFDAFARMGNVMWKTCIAEGVTPKEMVKKGIVPRPDSLETFMMIMGMAFDPEAARDAKAEVQFDFSGEVEGSCHFAVSGGRCAPGPGPGKNPDLVIEAPFEVWMDVITGKADPAGIFGQGKATSTGDMSLMGLFRREG